MISFTYDPCLLYTSPTTSSQTGLGIVNMQIDDTLILADQSFATAEEEAIHSAKIMTKTKSSSTLKTMIDTNKINLNTTE